MYKPIRILVIALCALVLLAPERRTQDYGDHIGNYNFRLEIDGVAAGYFAGVDGLSVEQEVIEYQSGADPTVRKRPGQLKWENIALKRGYHTDARLSRLLPERGNEDDPRTSFDKVAVVLVSGKGEEVRRWDYFACFPQKWELASVPFARDGTRLEERLTFACDYFVES